MFSYTYEKLVLNYLQSRLRLNELQFGFKANCSAQHAVFTLKETIFEQIIRGKPVYICVIDFSKAFDRISRHLMILKLIGKVDTRVIKSLMEYYIQSYAYVDNKGEKSEIFRTNCGVKQGGPLSPFLYSVYVDDMIEKIQSLNAGCLLGAIMIGIIMFADDTVLISNSIIQLQKQLDVLSVYCKKHSIQINADKTKYICFGSVSQRHIRNEKVILDNVTLKKVTEITYLGVTINNNHFNTSHIKSRSKSAINASYGLTPAGFRDKITKPSIKSLLMKTYCRPSLMYGVETIRLNQTNIKDMETLEGNLIKSSLSISKRCSTKVLMHAMDIEPTFHTIQKRKFNFFRNLMENPLTSKILKYILSKQSRLSIRTHSIVPEIVSWINKPFKHMLELEQLIKQKLNDMSIKIEGERSSAQVAYIKPYLQDREFIQNTLRTWTEVT